MGPLSVVSHFTRENLGKCHHILSQIKSTWHIDKFFFLTMTTIPYCLQGCSWNHKIMLICRRFEPYVMQPASLTWLWRRDSSGIPQGGICASVFLFRTCTGGTVRICNKIKKSLIKSFDEMAVWRRQLTSSC